MAQNQEQVDLLADSERTAYFTYGVRLYKAALKGDWKTAELIHAYYPGCFAAKITELGDTALHIAAVTTHTDFVSKLVRVMVNPDDPNCLRLRNNVQNTALCVAATSGTVAIATAMLEEDSELANITGNLGMTPLLMAAEYGNKDMVNHLYPLKSNLSEGQWDSLFISTINTDLYDIALRIITDHPQVAIARDVETKQTPLHILATKSCENPKGFWSRIVSSKEKRALHTKLEVVKLVWQTVLQKSHADRLDLITRPWEILFEAVEVGNVEFVTTLIDGYPDLILQLDEKNRSIFHVAVQFRRDTIFSLMSEIGSLKGLLVTYTDSGADTSTDNEISTGSSSTPMSDYISLANSTPTGANTSTDNVISTDRTSMSTPTVCNTPMANIRPGNEQPVEEKCTDNNILHLAAILPPSDRLNCVSGAALQMQREMLWFKAVKDIVPSQFAKTKNKDGKTPKALFNEEHKELRKEGEEWMRKTAGSCSVVATLIAGVVFATAQKVLESKDLSTHQSRRSHLVFTISVSSSFISSTAAILMFLSIMTSRYAEMDFLISLPLKLMIGRTLLLVSIASMMIAYVAIFFIVLNHSKVIYSVAVLAGLPIVLFAFQEFTMLLEMCHSTIGCNSMFKTRHLLFGSLSTTVFPETVEATTQNGDVVEPSVSNSDVESGVF